MKTAQKPLAKAYLFADHGCGCAMIGKDLQEGNAEFEPIDYVGAELSFEWHQAAFLACTVAFRRLQARHADLDVVCTLELPSEWITRHSP